MHELWSETKGIEIAHLFAPLMIYLSHRRGKQDVYLFQRKSFGLWNNDGGPYKSRSTGGGEQEEREPENFQ
jgi:hypothetical protein